jgi:hypothetical protein
LTKRGVEAIEHEKVEHAAQGDVAAGRKDDAIARDGAEFILERRTAQFRPLTCRAIVLTE